MRFWIDNETLMPLKSQRFNSEERLLETIQFDEIHFDRNDSAAEINTDGLTKLSPPSPQPNEDSEKKIELDFHPLKLEKIPMGFKEIAASIFPKNNNIVLETNYTDGLATFSTYQRRQTSEEKEAQAKEPEKERWKVKKFKDKDIYYREIEGIRIVVVGELDECSMNYILYNMQAENPHPRSDSDPGRHE